ncbi:ABC transporter permease [Microlunatus lacustris]
MIAALEFELLKARRAAVFRWGAVAVGAGVPALCTLFFQLARSGGGSPGALKAAAMIPALDLAGLVAMAGQVLSVAVLLTAGIATSWSFGREHVDGAAAALFATATPRPAIAAAKFLVLTAWASATVLAAVALTLTAGLLLQLPLNQAALDAAMRAVLAGLLSALLALPLGLVASWRRGYLAGFVVLVLVIVATQIITATGGGHWFPYAVPSLWAGMGGAEAAADISPLGLLTVPLTAALGIVATLYWWSTFEEF